MMDTTKLRAPAGRLHGLPSGRAGIELREVDLVRSAPLRLGDPGWRLVYRLSEPPTEAWVRLFTTLRPAEGPVGHAWIDGCDAVVDVPSGPPWSAVRDQLRAVITATNGAWREARAVARASA